MRKYSIIPTPCLVWFLTVVPGMVCFIVVPGMFFVNRCARYVCFTVVPGMFCLPLCPVYVFDCCARCVLFTVVPRMLCLPLCPVCSIIWRLSSC